MKINLSLLILIIAFSFVASFSQVKVSQKKLTFLNKKVEISETQYKAVCKENFVGENVNLNVVNADIKDILNYITDEYGFAFVVDKNLTLKPVTRKAVNVPWNLELEKILKEQGLGIQCNDEVLRVATQKTIDSEADPLKSCGRDEDAKEPLYTEFVELKNIKIKTIGEERLGDTVDPIFDEKGNEFIDLIKKRLSKRGSVEVGRMEKKTVLVLTDERNNLDALVELVKLLDVPEKSVN